MKPGIKQVQMTGFELILSQDVATASGNPLECFAAPQKIHMGMECGNIFLGPPWPRVGQKGCGGPDG